MRGTMNQQPSSILGDPPPRPTEVRLRPPTGELQGRPATFDATQIAGAAAYAILLYLGILYGLNLVAGTAGMAPRLQSTIALIGSLLLTGVVFGVMAVLRDRLARRPAGAAPEQIIRLDDALRWLVPADLMQSYTGPMTMLRLNLLDLLATAHSSGYLQQHMQHGPPRSTTWRLPCSPPTMASRTPTSTRSSLRIPWSSDGT